MKSANQIIVDSLKIFSPSGRMVDAKYLLKQLVIKESMNDAFMSGRVTLVDDHDHYEILPIVGQETLVLTVDTLDRIFDFTFSIYKVSDIRKMRNGQSEYTLHFVSEELIINQNEKISKAYQNELYSNMIEDVLKNELRTPKNLAIEPTLNKATHVVPNISPLKTIKQICRKAVSAETEQSNYVFFEDRRGFVSVPMSTFAREKVKYTYEKSMITGADTNSLTSPFQIMEVKMSKQTDALDALSRGMFASSLHAIDPILQTIDVYENGYFDEFEQREHLNDFPLYFDEGIYNAEGQQYFNYTNEKILENEYVNSHDSSILPELSSSSRLRRRIQNLSYNNVVIQSTIPGNALIFIGDIIDLKIQSGVSTEEKQHRLMGGNSMVTAITSIIGGNNSFMQVLETAKDSVVEDLAGSL